MKKVLISVVIPTFNEEEIISSSVDNWVKNLRKTGDNFEIIIGDDGSDDGTPRILNEKSDKYDEIKIISNKENMGRGNILKKCFDICRGDIYMYSDADLIIKPEFIKDILSGLKEAEVVIGSKHLSGSKIRHPPMRRILSKMHSISANILLKQNISDYQCGIKAFKKEIFLKFPKTKFDRWSWDTEFLLIAKKKGFRIKELPARAEMYKRKSKVNYRDVLKMISDLIRLAIETRKREYVDVIMINPYLDYFKQGFSNRAFQPISLGIIASMLRQIGFGVEIIDANLRKIEDDNRLWTKLRARYFVLTTAQLDRWQCPSVNIKPVTRIIENILENNENSKIMVIGPHGSTDPEIFNKLSNDSVLIIKGEPEKPVFNIISGLEKGQETTKSSRNSKTIFPDLTMPAYDLFDMRSYKHNLLGGNFSIVESSRGCPYSCKFCLKSMYPNTYTRKEVKQVVDELEHLVKNHGVKNVFFIDLNFNADRSFVFGICDEVLRRNLKFRWSAQCRIDLVDDGLLKKMKEAGCILIQYGVESGSQKLLEKMGKNILLDDTIKIFKMTKNMGIRTLAFFMLSSQKELIYARDLTEKIRPDYVSFVPMINYFEKGFDPKKDLIDISQKANIWFYTRPGNILNLISFIREPDDIRSSLLGFYNTFIPSVLR